MAEQPDGPQPWQERPVTLSEMSSVMTSLGCGRAPHLAPTVELAQGPDGLMFTAGVGEGGIEIRDPFAASDVARTVAVNGRHLQDALKAHTAANLKGMTAADISISDDGDVQVGEVNVFKYGDNAEQDRELTRAKESLNACGQPEWEPRTTAQGFNDELGLVLQGTSRESSRPILTGVLFTDAGDQNRMVATDSYRLFTSTVNVPRGLVAGGQLMPGPDLGTWRKAADRHLGKNADPAQLGVSVDENDQGRTIVGLHTGQMRMASRPIAGDFPSYESLFPASFDEGIVTINSAELVAMQPGVKRNFTNAPLRLQLQHGEGGKTDKLGWSVIQKDIGEESGSVPALAPLPRFGKDSEVPDEIGINPEFFRDSLRFASGSPKGGANVEMRRWHHLKPIVFTSEGAPADWRKADRVALNMPVRLN